MARIDDLLDEYRNQLRLPRAAVPERTWMLVYDRADERRLRARLDRFAEETRAANLSWHLVDLTRLVSEWMGEHRYAEAYFHEPDLAQSEVFSVAERGIQRLRDTFAEALESPGAGRDSVVAVVGAGGLFGFASVSDLLRHVEGEIPGRLVVFFPGSLVAGRLRLLDGRDGWDYRARLLTGQR